MENMIVLRKPRVKHFPGADSAEELHALGGRLARRNTKTLRRLTSPAEYGSQRRQAACSAQPAALAAASSPGWEGTTQRLVGASTLPFLLLLLPQLWKNHVNLSSGNAAALAVLSWLSYLTGLFGNTLLLCYFTAKQEYAACTVQAIGIASSFAVLTQVRAAGYMPRSMYAGTAAVVACTALLTALKLGGRLDRSKAGQRLWAAWQQTLGLVGLAVVPQVLAATAGSSSLLPGGVALIAGLGLAALSARGMLPAPVQAAWSAASACTATALFMLQPVPQLLANFTDPSSLVGLSSTTVLLATLGNSLMVPRALWTADAIWSTGSLWGCLVFGWGQMLSMYAGRPAGGGPRYLGGPAFAAASLALLAWLAFVFAKTAALRRQAAATQPPPGAGAPPQRD